MAFKRKRKLKPSSCGRVVLMDVLPTVTPPNHLYISLDPIGWGYWINSYTFQRIYKEPSFVERHEELLYKCLHIAIVAIMAFAIGALIHCGVSEEMVCEELCEDKGLSKVFVAEDACICADSEGNMKGVWRAE